MLAVVVCASVVVTFAVVETPSVVLVAREADVVVRGTVVAVAEGVEVDSAAAFLVVVNCSGFVVVFTVLEGSTAAVTCGEPDASVVVEVFLSGVVVVVVSSVEEIAEV